jgi:hypothetical protein
MQMYPAYRGATYSKGRELRRDWARRLGVGGRSTVVGEHLLSVVGVGTAGKERRAEKGGGLVKLHLGS